MKKMEAERLTVSYEKRLVIDSLNVAIPAGKVTALVGPNGSGKSTLLKAMSRLLKPTSGRVYLNGADLHQLATVEVARQLSILPQTPIAPEGITVGELVSYGRYPHQTGYKKLTLDDIAIIDWALTMTNMMAFKHVAIDHMSGGQRQRAWIAMTLAQQTDVMFLDEPTTYLDMEHQLEVLQLLRRINEERGTTVVMVVHDLNHATRYADHIVTLRDGAIVSEGRPEVVVTPTLLLDVFNVHAHVMRDPLDGVPICVPYALKQSEKGSAPIDAVTV